jgi:3-deoxy-manno-octulosonate cytidylyltransferase (CMP-KDO synthetase)
MAFGGHVIMTSPDCGSGTERCNEASEKIDSDVIVNVQGDEPLIDPQSLELVISPFQNDDEKSVSMSTLKHPLLHYADYVNPNVVKVVCDEMDTALYFSRSPLPYYRDQAQLLDEWKRSGARPDALLPPPMKHIGVYAYRTTFLQALSRLPPSPLETAEMLEQLRALAWGFKIKAVTTPHDSAGVDTPEDVAKVEAMIAEEVDP